MLFVLPLEQLEERYTGQWYRWFKEKLEEKFIPHQYIDGQQLTTKVETGVVLDAAGTNYWKFSQMMEVCRLFKEGKIQNGDKFFTMDLWHPALESIPYMAQLFGIQVDVYGFLHAGSYYKEDFAEPMADWATYFEQGWAKICKGIFVGSKYHKDLFIGLRGENQTSELEDKIWVTGNPFKTEEFYNQSGEICPQESRGKTIVYPNRFDIEKRPNVFMDLMDELWPMRQDFKVIFTTSREKFRSNQPDLIERLYNSRFNFEIRENLTKAEYYQVLAASRIYVSTAVDETFGYCLLESLTAGCIPIVAESFSYPEVLDYDKRFLVSEGEGMLEKINYYLDNDIKVPIERAKYYDFAIDKMIEIMYGEVLR